MEIHRNYNFKIDLLSVFIAIFSVQVILPGIFIPLLIYIGSGRVDVNNFFIDRVYHELLPEFVWLSAVLAMFFVLFLYIGFFIASKNNYFKNFNPNLHLSASYIRYSIVITLGIASSYTLLNSLSNDDFLSQYSQLILIRALDTSVADSRNFLVANLFSLTQTFSIVSIVGIFIVIDKKFKFQLILLIIIIFIIAYLGLMTGSRRGIAIQFFLIYIVYCIYSNKWHISLLLIMSIIFFPILIFGKEYLAQVSLGFAPDDISYNADSQSLLVALLSGFSSLGITLNSSWATFMFIDMPYRFGFDHIVAALRFLPLGSLGVDEDALYPTRIVRVATEIFLGKEELDIPPGILGQMWLDFGFLGPVLWGITYGLSIACLQVIFEKYKNNLANISLFVIIIFIFALPLNTGSFDYNFSVDVFFLFVALIFIFKISKNNNINR